MCVEVGGIYNVQQVEKIQGEVYKNINIRRAKKCENFVKISY